MSPEIPFLRPLDTACGERMVVAMKVNNLCSLDPESFDPEIHLPQVREVVSLFDSKLHPFGGNDGYSDMISVGNFIVRKLRNNGYGELRFVYNQYNNSFAAEEVDEPVRVTSIIYSSDTKEILTVDQSVFLGYQRMSFGIIKRQENIRIWPRA